MFDTILRSCYNLAYVLNCCHEKPTCNNKSRSPSFVGEKLNEMGQEQRYRNIKHRKRLIDLAKAQAQEIAMLRTELERLRRRNFPALVRRDI